MSFSIQWLDSNGEMHTTEWNSGNYPIDKSRTSPELGSIGVPSNAIAVTPYVQVYWGNSADGTPYVQYVPGSPNVATYNATGTTLDVHVNLVQ